MAFLVSMARPEAEGLQPGRSGVQSIPDGPFTRSSKAGYEATRTISVDRRFRSLPIIAMTANVMAGERDRCLDTGMNDHLTKPVDTDALFAALAKWRGRMRRQQ